VNLEVFRGNLLARADCVAAMQDVKVVYHLATGRDGRSYPDAFMNAVVTTRNLLDAALVHGTLRRFVNVSSLAVYANTGNPRGRLLDETAPIESHPELRGDAYCYAKVRQDELVMDYGARSRIPYVIVRPGYILGPEKTGVSSRVGIGTFGVFLHLGGSNPMPFTYVDNCADAIVLAGLRAGIDGEVFNVVDDDLPSSREFLRLYKRHVTPFRSLYVPHALSYALCNLWERYSNWSHGQLPPTFNRRHWHAYWKRTRYTNEKLKACLGWQPRVGMQEGLMRCFEAYRTSEASA
jgi:nucleoside-diphosphate-sugar epimerase